MAEKEDMEWRWVFARFYVFPRPNIKKRFSLMEFLDIRRHDVWTVHGWLHFSWLGISASSFHIFKLREIYERLACSYSGNKTLFLILNMCYEHTTLVWDLQQSYVNVPCEKRLHFRCVSWRAKSSLCGQPFNFLSCIRKIRHAIRTQN